MLYFARHSFARHALSVVAATLVFALAVSGPSNCQRTLRAQDLDSGDTSGDTTDSSSDSNSGNNGNNTNFIVSTGAVGGIMIDANGMLLNASVDQVGQLAEMRRRALGPSDEAFGEAIQLRKISLRKLEAAIQDQIDHGQPIGEDIFYLAGLQRIEYVFVDPEHNDIVLAGPGEAWQLDDRGNVVGVTTGRPVMNLDDLLVALRSAKAAAQGGISCSIDPTPDGLNRMRAYVSQLRGIGPNPEATILNIQESVGPQTIRVAGVPTSSHFARVLVAADYRMKRLAMAFDPAPVDGMPSFMQLVKAAPNAGQQNMLPRWWLEPRYDSVLKDETGLAWQLRPEGIVCQTEEDFLDRDGKVGHSGRRGGLANRWASLMTERYDELALADPIFGQLESVVDLAVVAALIVKEDLTGKAQYSMPLLMDPVATPSARLESPTEVASQASVVRQSRQWVISVSGGVEINSWQLADRIETDAAVAGVREKSLAGDVDRWWWN
ncbi:MAG: DUF1598 domain-containing protein [Pirellulales bacterium]